MVTMYLLLLQQSIDMHWGHAGGMLSSHTLT